MNAIITVLGRDAIGIIAKVTGLLSQNNVNILDISQTIMQGIFTMTMYADVTNIPDFGDLQKQLTDLGKTIGVVIEMRHENIFNAMHRI